MAEIVGCYLPYLWLKEGKSAWLLFPAAAGRVYAAYGGVYVFVAILWLWAVDGVRPTAWDLFVASIALTCMAIIMFAPKNA